MISSKKWFRAFALVFAVSLAAAACSDDTTDTVDDAVDEVQDDIGNAVDEVEDAVEEAADETEDVIEDAVDDAEDVAGIDNDGDDTTEE